MAIRVRIDRELCSGYANCLDAAPEIFDLDQHDVAVIVAESAVIDARRLDVELAAKLCPRRAITIEEAD